MHWILCWIIGSHNSWITHLLHVEYSVLIYIFYRIFLTSFFHSWIQFTNLPTAFKHARSHFFQQVKDIVINKKPSIITIQVKSNFLGQCKFLQEDNACLTHQKIETLFFNKLVQKINNILIKTAHKILPQETFHDKKHLMPYIT